MLLRFSSSGHYKLLACLLAWNMFRLSTHPAVKRRKPLLDRPLVLYAYYESDDAFQNAEFFVRHGIHGGADFLFFSQGNGSRLAPLLPLDRPNVQFTERDNACFDIGSYGIILNEEIAPGIRRRDRYKSFILMNASIRGPLLPYWAMAETCWSKQWLQPLSDVIKMVGLTYNCRPWDNMIAHVQSMILALDSTSIDVLMQPGPGSLSRCYADYHDAVHNGETRVTERINLAGYEVHPIGLYNSASFLLTVATQDVTMAFGTHQTPVWRHFCTTPDMNTINGYFGFQMHPFEGMFVKTKKVDWYHGYSPTGTLKLTTWMDNMNHSSSYACDKLYKPFVA